MKLTEMIENAKDDIEYIGKMINDFNKLYPICELNLEIKFDNESITKYVKSNIDK